MRRHLFPRLQTNSEEDDGLSRVVVAIDGPAASGKTTLAKLLAQRLGLPHIDTGAMYRAFALKAIRNDCVGPGQGFTHLLGTTKIELKGSSVILDGEDVTGQIRDAAVTDVVSAVAADPELRTWMLERQRALVGADGVVMEGRDIGTVVLPDADLKVFLTADEDARAARRSSEQDGDFGDVDQTLEAVRRRDEQDSKRKHSPLVAAKDAIIIDSTTRTPAEIVELLMQRLETKDGS